MTIAVDIQEKAQEIILAGLRAQDHGPVRFEYARSVVRLNALDEEFLDVSVIYDGAIEDLNTRRLIGLYGEIELRLLEIGIEHIPSVGYIPKDEDDCLMSKVAAKRASWGQG